MTSSVLNYFAIISTILITAGMVKLYIYYKAFKIRIFDFIDIQEIIIAFADNLLAFFLVSIIAILFGYIFVSNAATSFSSTTATLVDRILAYTLENWSLLLLLILANIATIIFAAIRKNIFWYEGALAIILQWMLSIVIPVMLFEFSMANVKDPATAVADSIILPLWCVSIWGYALASAFSEIHKVKRLGYFLGSEFAINDYHVTSGQDYYYVGQSKCFIFFYSTKAQGSSEIIPISSVKSFKFKR